MFLYLSILIIPIFTQMSDPSDECDEVRRIKMREISKTAKLINHSITKTNSINGLIFYEHWKYEGLTSSPMYSYMNSTNAMWLITQRRGTGDSVIAIDSTNVGFQFVRKNYQFDIPVKFQRKGEDTQRKFSWKYIHPTWATTCDEMGLAIEAATFQLTQAPLQVKPTDSTELVKTSSNPNSSYSNKNRLKFVGHVKLTDRNSVLGSLTYRNKRIELGSIHDSEKCTFVPEYDTICVAPIVSKAKILSSTKRITLF